MNVRRTERWLGALIALLWLAIAPVGHAVEPPLILRNAILIDPAAAQPAGPSTVVIIDGVIDKILPPGAAPMADDVRQIDVAGRFVLPGLADMHNHLRNGTFRPDHDQLAVLRVLLDWGVTTTFDPGVPADRYGELRDAVSGDPSAYPRTFLIKGIFTVAGGWGRGHTPASPAEARQIVRELSAAGSDGVKLMVDDMSWATTRPFPVMEPSVMAAIIHEAHLHGMKSFAHAPLRKYAEQALRAGVDCLVHGILDEPVDQDFIELMLENDACYISTLSMFQTNDGLKAWADRLDAFDERDVLDAETLELFRRAPAGTPRLDNTAWAAAHLPVLRQNLVTVSRFGIPIVIGTDTGIPGVLPGIATQLELVLHVEAGLSPAESLAAATINAARMMGRDKEFGRLAEGLAADLLILDADPRDDIRNIRTIRHVIRAGRLHR